MTVYDWRSGSRFTGDPELVAAELERLRLERGALQAEAVVEEAAAMDSPLHLPQFLWDDDTQAAHEFRLEVARRLIRAIVIDVGRGKDNPERYVYTNREYVPLSGIEEHRDDFMMAVAAAQQDLESAQRRLRHLLNQAKATKGRKNDVPTIMLAVQALQTANEAIHALH